MNLITVYQVRPNDTQAIREALKQHGFRVLRSEGEGAFSAYYNNNALYFIKIHIKKA